ncbi:MAG TPA: response regulator transcription factor [Gaiellaceae bacterium]|jgi:CheY-like chemotaxis protein
MKKLSLFQSGTGLATSHAVDVPHVDVEAGASLARHIPRLQAILTVVAAAALPSRWSPRDTRAAAAEDFDRNPLRGTGSRIEPAAWLSYDGLMRTVLVVDDHPTFRATARGLLAAEGFDVVGEAEDGRTALAEVERLRPEIVLLDVQLPDIDGFEVAARLLARGGAAPQIVLTSSRDASDFGPLVDESGARGFVAKDELSGAAIAALVK